MNFQAADVAPSEAFLQVALDWGKANVESMFQAVWSGYDTMVAAMPFIDSEGLERSITQSLAIRIEDALSGDETFALLHGPYEYETKKPPPAQPPAYDIAFVLRQEERIMWPLEAKVMETQRQTAEYITDLKDEFLTCRYAPFVSFGAMVGYLLTGEPKDALEVIERKLSHKLNPYPKFQTRPHRISMHTRTVPKEKYYQLDFTCHHMILAFHGLARGKSREAKELI